MEIILKKEQLVPTLNTVLDVVDNKTAHAIYSNVLISVLDNEIEFTGTDAESQVTIQSPFSEIKSTGTTTVNAKKFNEPYSKEIARLVIHGSLHLLGYEDSSKKDKEEMTKKEDIYLAKVDWSKIYE